MSDILSEKIASLLKQAKYTPEAKKLEQLDACEHLLRIISPGKKYPFEFIRATITGYHPEGTSRGLEETEVEPLSYETLLNDLVCYAEQISKLVNTPAEKLAISFETVESLSEKYNVSTKTVRRWRSKGLSGRYLRFEDGKQKLVFTSKMVDHFVKENAEQVKRGTQFTRSSEQVKALITARLEKWADRYPDYRQEAIRRTAKKYGRSAEMVRSLLVTSENSGLITGFKKRSAKISGELAESIIAEHKKGVSAAQLSEKYGKPQNLIKQVVNRHIVRELQNTPFNFMDSPDFQNSDSTNNILKQVAELKLATASNGDNSISNGEKRRAEADMPRAAIGMLEMYHKDLSIHETLSAEEEKNLFRIFNFLKFQAEQMRLELDDEFPDSQLIQNIADNMKLARKLKNKLVRHNLRLVVSTARKHAADDIEMSEYISEGNMVLMRAVEKFDYYKGNKFSTYATWAIIKRFATLRATMARRAEQVVFVADEILDIAHNLRTQPDQISAVEQANKDIVKVMNETLDTRERQIICGHYGVSISSKPENQRPQSLRQIAELLNLSKERVRQIEMQALKKLRGVMSPEQFDFLLKM